VTVVLVSKTTDSAFYEREEIAAAISYSRMSPSLHRVVPVYLDGRGLSSDAIPYGLRVKHGVAVSDTTTLNDVAERLLT